ncbi:MAG: ABC transporter substrate-binding protein [Candidatus Latescibacterota bacterium]
MTAIARWAFRLSLGLALACWVEPLPAAGPPPYPAAYSSGAEKQFARGVEAYRKKRYSEARSRFERVLQYPLNQRSSAGQLMLARALFREGEQALALEAARALEQRYPGSRYVPHAHLLQGDAYVALRQYFPAAAQYTHALSAGPPLEVQARAAERLAALVRSQFINDEGVARVRTELGEGRFRDVLLFGEARWYRRLGWEAQSQAAAARYLDAVPQGAFTAMAERWVGDARPAAGSRRAAVAPGVPTAATRPRLGLLLPMSGAQRQVGQDLHAGVQLANEELGSPFELVVADIGSEYGEVPISESQACQLLRVAQQARHLAADEHVLAVIGPVYSGDCVAAAAVVEAAGVPLLAPLAQQSGLDQLGRYVFQISPTPEAQARTLAEHATAVLGLRNLVVLAPLTDYGYAFQREFAAAAEASGGRIVHSDWYVPEATRDFQRVFDEVRRAGLALAPAPYPSLEQGLLTQPAETSPAWVDSSGLFLDTIDGMAIVAESFGDATTIAPQLRFHRLKTQILGNDAWYQPEALRRMRPQERSNVQGAVVVSGYSESSPGTRRFLGAFRQRFHREAGYAAQGYDAGRLVILAWQEGHRDAAAVRDWLAGVRQYQGASGRITFPADRRTNAEVVLLRIDGRGRYLPEGSEGLPGLGRADGAAVPELDEEGVPSGASPPGEER